MRYESTLAGARRRLLALIALYGPGAETTRVRLHRLRGVKIGSGCFIGTDVIIETAFPHLVEIGDRRRPRHADHDRRPPAGRARR